MGTQACVGGVGELAAATVLAGRQVAGRLEAMLPNEVALAKTVPAAQRVTLGPVEAEVLIADSTAGGGRGRRVVHSLRHLVDLQGDIVIPDGLYRELEPEFIPDPRRPLLSSTHLIIFPPPTVVVFRGCRHGLKVEDVHVGLDVNEGLVKEALALDGRKKGAELPCDARDLVRILNLRNKFRLIDDW